MENEREKHLPCFGWVFVACSVLNKLNKQNKRQKLNQNKIRWETERQNGEGGGGGGGKRRKSRKRDRWRGAFVRFWLLVFCCCCCCCCCCCYSFTTSVQRHGFWFVSFGVCCPVHGDMIRDTSAWCHCQRQSLYKKRWQSEVISFTGGRFRSRYDLCAYEPRDDYVSRSTHI